MSLIEGGVRLSVMLAPNVKVVSNFRAATQPDFADEDWDVESISFRTVEGVEIFVMNDGLSEAGYTAVLNLLRQGKGERCEK